jgi:tRNA(Ile)-lysidine synthase
MWEAFDHHIRTEFPELFEKRFLIACSGGKDSVALTHLCHRSGLDFALAHCNFQLRGKESDLDEALVQELGKSIKIEVYVKRFDTVGYINKNKLNVQLAARELRYNWFEKLQREKDFSYVLTAHHALDALETFIINLSRGSGLEGLTGIPDRNQSLRRPLLIFDQEQIAAFAKSEKLLWREDQSNAEDYYLRNRIRHYIVPELLKLEGNFMSGFKKTLRHLSGSQALVRGHIETLRSEILREENGLYRLSVERLKTLHPSETYLFELLKEFGFTDWKAISQLLNAQSGKMLHSSTHTLLKGKEELILREKAQVKKSKEYSLDTGEASFEGPLRFEISTRLSMGETAPEILYADKETLKQVLTLRKWRKGDYFYPLGMKGKKSISKYFRDNGLSLFEKEDQWLLCNGDEVVWIVGRRADERFKVTEKTKEILQIKWKSQG